MNAALVGIVLTGCFVVAAPWAAARFTLRRDHRQRLWRRTSDLYEQVADQVHAMQVERHSPIGYGRVRDCDVEAERKLERQLGVFADRTFLKVWERFKAAHHRCLCERVDVERLRHEMEDAAGLPFPVGPTGDELERALARLTAAEVAADIVQEDLEYVLRVVARGASHSYRWWHHLRRRLSLAATRVRRQWADYGAGRRAQQVQIERCDPSGRADADPEPADERA